MEETETTSTLWILVIVGMHNTLLKRKLLCIITLNWMMTNDLSDRKIRRTVPLLEAVVVVSKLEVQPNVWKITCWKEWFHQNPLLTPSPWWWWSEIPSSLTLVEYAILNSPVHFPHAFSLSMSFLRLPLRLSTHFKHCLFSFVDQQSNFDVLPTFFSSIWEFLRAQSVARSWTSLFLPLLAKLWLLSQVKSSSLLLKPYCFTCSP